MMIVQKRVSKNKSPIYWEVAGMKQKISLIKPVEDYRLSFGTGGLYVIESGLLIQAYSFIKDWDNVIEDAAEQNLLQFKSKQSTRRAVREIWHAWSICPSKN